MLLQKPSDDEVRRFINAQSKLPFSYRKVGASVASAPQGYSVNHYKGKLGTGRETFKRAAAALRAWKMYDLSWTKLYWPETPIKEEEVVAVLAKHFGLWSLNACRIIYTIKESVDSRGRSGFAFGTLPGHILEGEERFTIEWDVEKDEVWYELFAFARPKPLLVKLCSPLARLIQRRFAIDSFDAMRRAINSGVS